MAKKAFKREMNMSAGESSDSDETKMVDETGPESLDFTPEEESELGEYLHQAKIAADQGDIDSKKKFVHKYKVRIEEIKASKSSKKEETDKKVVSNVEFTTAEKSTDDESSPRELSSDDYAAAIYDQIEEAIASGKVPQDRIDAYRKSQNKQA